YGRSHARGSAADSPTPPETSHTPEPRDGNNPSAGFALPHRRVRPRGERRRHPMTDADERRVGKALQGLEFPAGRDDIIAFANERGAHEKTLRALYALPRRSYASTADVEDAVPQRPEEVR